MCGVGGAAGGCTEENGRGATKLQARLARGNMGSRGALVGQASMQVGLFYSQVAASKAGFAGWGQDTKSAELGSSWGGSGRQRARRDESEGASVAGSDRQNWRGHARWERQDQIG